MKSWPWDARKVGMGDNGFPLYDRSYNAQELRDVFARFFANGIFTDTSNALQVLENNGMTVVVKPGDCIIKGSYGWEENDRELEFTAAGAKDRIDTVVLRWDNSVEQRKIDLYVVSGTPADVPTRPELTRNNVVYELGIADVFIPKNTTSITASRITDTRLESARCGVAMPFAQVNTSSFNEILTSMMNELRSQTQTAIELAQNALDETEAGYLQNQITDLDKYKIKYGDILTVSKEEETLSFWKDLGTWYGEFVWEKSGSANIKGTLLSLVTPKEIVISDGGTTHYGYEISQMVNGEKDSSNSLYVRRGSYFPDLEDITIWYGDQTNNGWSEVPVGYKPIKYTYKVYAEVQIPSTGYIYYDTIGGVPPEIPSKGSIVSAFCSGYGNSTPNVAIACCQEYIMGSPNQKLENLRIGFLYI